MELVPLKLSIGGWCLTNPGADPFGAPVRDIKLEEALAVVGKSPIQFVSFHDHDLWPDDASPSQISETIAETQELVWQNELAIYNFTANLFSHRAFRSGAFSSPFLLVRAAAILKGCAAMDAAAEFGAKNVIWWGGREGSDGAYEQDPGLGLRRYMEGLKICVCYGLAKGYDFQHAIEPKVYEPRLLGLYAGTGASAASAIRHFFSEPELQGRVKVNPEYPQHVAMLGLDPVFELGQLLEEGMLASFFHFGGQIGGRMDCDLPPGWGGNLLADFHLCRILHERGWKGVVELDCRTPRTTTGLDGLRDFIEHSARYWWMLEDKVRIYLNDPEIKELRNELDRPVISSAHEALLAGDENVLGHVQAMRNGAPSLEVVAGVDMNAIQHYQHRVLWILSGTA